MKFHEKKKLGSSTSFVHGKEKEIICHDMRKYVWQNYDFLQNVKKKRKRAYSEMDITQNHGF